MLNGFFMGFPSFIKVGQAKDRGQIDIMIENLVGDDLMNNPDVCQLVLGELTESSKKN